MDRPGSRARRFRLWPRPRWRRQAAPWLVLAAFALNVSALAIPFLAMRRGLSSSEYSLPKSVSLLWDSGLYVLAIIVVAFSIVFPFAKLAVLWSIFTGRLPPTRRAGWLDFVERFGKWSMLDVFLVCIMLALANDQLLVDAEPRIGSTCFSVAIVLAMIASGRVARTFESPSPRAEIASTPFGGLVALQAALLVLLAVALCVPFLEIDDWLLSDHPVSILGAVAGLWRTGAVAMAIVVAAFLVFAPLLVSGWTLKLLLRARQGGVRARDVNAIRVLRRFDMLDVFALALGIFLVEGRSFVRTELAWGAFLIALLLLSYGPLSALSRRRIAAKGAVFTAIRRAKPSP